MRLQSGQHDNIVKILRHESFGPHTGAYFIDLQYCDINLDEYIRGSRPPCLALYNYLEAKENDDLPLIICGIIQQVLNGLIFIHEKGQVHRDLKPMNGTFPMPLCMEFCC
jgi:serine/threonine protein kinase